MTLVELIVAMGIFTVVIAVFLSGVVVMTQNTARAREVSDAGDEVRRAFQRLDKEVRYASAINRPGPGSGDRYYVEYLITAVDAGDDPLCVQWRVDPATRVLERRSWADEPSPSPSSWLTIVTDVRNTPATDEKKPFIFTEAGNLYLNQRLQFLLDVGPGPSGPSERAGAQLDATFVARNTDTTTPTNVDTNDDEVSDLPVCLTGAGRP